MNITEIPIGDLDPDPDNIREDALDNIHALAADIKDRGLQTPLHVYPHGDRWKIWGGHRRWAALCMNGAATAACIVKTPPRDAVEKLDGMVSENLHREQLNPIEEAKVYRRYLDAGLGFNQHDVAARCHTAQSRVSTYLSLLTELTEDEQRRVARGEISPTQALKTVKERRRLAGRARSDSGGQHGMTNWSSHFNRNHPLVTVADSRCRNAGHRVEDKIGGACGVCWEWAIRRDERAAADIGADSTVPTTVPAQAPVVSCGACGVAYSSETKYSQCVVDDRTANKRIVASQHNWRHRADRTAKTA